MCACIYVLHTYTHTASGFFPMPLHILQLTGKEKKGHKKNRSNLANMFYKNKSVIKFLNLRSCTTLFCTLISELISLSVMLSIKDRTSYNQNKLWTQSIYARECKVASILTHSFVTLKWIFCSWKLL